jgi:uncharacterized membrane protein YidH (DUF202 family)
MDNKAAILNSYCRIRKIIGILGIALPVLVFSFHGEFLSSISHYYYTKSSIFFTSVLTAFGLFLVSYKGYEKDKKIERFSDNLITNIGGIAALVVVIFPTSGSGSNSPEINLMNMTNTYPLFGHNDTVINSIHLISAGIFLFIMGWMSFFKFSRTTNSRRKRIYKLAGYIIWSSIFILGTEFIFGFHITTYDVFILETVSVFSFGISWLIKGKAIEDIIYAGSQLKKIIPKKTSDPSA